MSAGPEPSNDLVAVACVVEASLLLASEWSRVLIEYVYPLLKRLHELHPTHQFRLAFVTYGAADTRPSPLLSKMYFAPLAQVTKEFREPSRLGIGQTGSGRGLSALEGFVAAIEFFDILMMSTANFNTNHAQSQSPQKDNRSLVSHLLHIAASPPDNAQRPQCNMLSHLDFLNWESIPVELRKRKISLSLISLRKIPQFQDLQSAVAGSSSQAPWFSVRAPHVLLLAGLPTPQKTSTKRQPGALPSDSSPDSKRQKVTVDPVSKASPESPALPPARTPQCQRPQQTGPLQVTQPPPTALPSQNPTPVHPIQATPSVPASTPATASPAPPPPTGTSIPPFNNDTPNQTVPQAALKMIERLAILDKEIIGLDSDIANAQNTGQTANLAEYHKKRRISTQIRDQIRLMLRQHFHKLQLAKENANAQASAAGSAPPAASTEAASSTQSLAASAPSASDERQTPSGATVDDHRPSVSDSQVLAQFWKSRGGTISTPNDGNAQAGPSQMQPPQTMTPEMVVQMQRLIEKKGIRPQSFGSSSQTPGTSSHEAVLNPNGTNSQANQAPNTNQWLGSFSFPKPGGQAANEAQMHVVGMFTTPMPTEIRTEIRTDQWPKNLTLNPCKEPLKDNSDIPSWLKRHHSRCRVMQFKANPRVPDGAMNEQRFQALRRSMTERRMFAYAGWQPPSGKFSFSIIIFPMAQNFFAGAVFPDGVPDLPGSGTALDVQPPIAEVKPPTLGGITFPPAFLARMQGLEPAKQKLVFAQFLRAQQEHLRRQQLQQSQAASASSAQAMDPLGMNIPQNPYGTVANIPIGLHANVNAPTSAGVYNAGGGTVNYEMLQSFMQRSADGSTSQGMNPGPMP